MTLARQRVGAEKTRLRPSNGGTRLPSQLVAAPSPCGEPSARFYPIADRAAARARRRHYQCPPISVIHRQAGLAAWRRLRQRHGSAEREIRWSESSAASSVLAFWMPRDIGSVLCRVTDVASSQPLLAACRGFERKLISGVQRRRRPGRQACLA